MAEDVPVSDSAGNSIPERPEHPGPPPRPPSSKPPNETEWLDFFSRVVVGTFTKVYVDFAFREVDENKLSDRELQRLLMTDAEKDSICGPFAELSVKSKFMRKHGRMIVASAGSIDSAIALWSWTGRVNRIAKKYRPQKNRRPNVRIRPAEATGTQPEPSANGYREYDPEESGFLSPGTG